MLEINLNETQQEWIKNLILRRKEETKRFYTSTSLQHCGFSSYDIPKIFFFDIDKTAFFEINKNDFVDRKDFEKVEICENNTIQDIGRWANFEFLPGTISDFEQVFPYSGVKQAKEIFSKRSRGYVNNYLIQYMDEYLHNPQIELVLKTCPEVIIDFTFNRDKIRISKFEKCFKNGRNMKEITGMPDWLWKLLNENSISIDTWDIFRIWYSQSIKEGKPLTKEFVEHFFSFIGSKVSATTVDKFRKIVKNAKSNENKSLFTNESLISYLERIDMYQAIDTIEGLDLLTDYIRMCKDLGIEPLTNSNSLKREHDVTARTHLEWKSKHIFENEIKGFEKRYIELSKYTFENDDLVVVIPKEPMDMVNEGRNNRNCVGSYVSSYANGRATIFFIRKKAEPDFSYITIQLNKQCEEIYQAYYGCNKPIDKQSDLDFIQSWLENNKTINKGRKK